ncbi:MAG: ABC transporter permease [Spirochaetaceae bacterium]|jgi:ribose transport system permease protein|nr:ABC transporter permease [Spirochaetaceae bacterium]
MKIKNEETLRGILKRFVTTNQIGMVLIFSVLLFLTNVILAPRSLNINAFGSIFALTVMLTIASAGQTIIIISGGGGIDLSVGAVMSLTALLTVGIMRGNEGYFLATLLMSIGLGAAAGLMNGAGVALIGLPPMIVTMCVANVATRLQYVLTEGKPSGTASPWFTRSMTYRIGGVIPTSIFYGLFIFILVIFILNRSRYGMRLFLTGNNERAAYLNGIRTVRVKMTAYVAAGILAGIAGFLGAGYMNFVRGSTFDTFTMRTIIAVVIGGTLLTGGKGSYIGTLMGALLITVLTNCLAVFNMSQSTTDMVMGIVLIIILAMYNRTAPVRQ